MESQPQNPEFRNNSENLHLCNLSFNMECQNYDNWSNFLKSTFASSMNPLYSNGSSRTY